MYESTPANLYLPKRIYREFLTSNFVRFGGEIVSNPWVQASSNYRTGVSLKAWRKIIAEGGNATTPFEGVRRSWSGRPGEIFHQRPNGKDWVRTRCTGYDGLDYPPITSMDETTANNQALKHLYRKLRQRRTRFGSLISLGELGETLRMLRRPAAALNKQVTRYLRLLKRKIKPKMKVSDFRQVAAGLWLEKSFGWDPLVNDIEEAKQAISSLGWRDSRLKLTATGVEEMHENPWGVNQLMNWDGADASCRRTIHQISRISVLYSVGVRVDTRPFTVKTAAQTLGLDWHQVVPALWELTPWSFLVDYFSNIGDILDSLSTVTSDVTWVCKNVKRQTVRYNAIQLDVKQFKQVYPQKNSYLRGDPGLLVTQTVKLTRTPVLEVPNMTLQFEVPGRPKQWLNMLALAEARRDLVTSLAASFGKGLKPLRGAR